jgi:hypothetical protein
MGKVTRKKTRSSDSKLFGGGPADLPTADLPTYGDVARYFAKLELEGVRSANEIVNVTIEKLTQIWKTANPRLPLRERQSLYRSLKIFYGRYADFRRNRIKLVVKDQLLKQETKLFDISSCSCPLTQVPCSSKFITCKKVSCTTKHFHCSCARKIPIEDREYMIDQRSKVGTRGKFQMGARDTSSKPVMDPPSLPNPIPKSPSPPPTILTAEEEVQFSEESHHSSSLETSGSSAEPEGGRGYYNLTKYPQFVLEAVRYEVSDEAAAALGNALLRDLGLLTKENAAEVIDPKKIEREKIRICKNALSKSEQHHQEIRCIGMDGRRDKGSLVFEEYEEEGTKCLRKTTKTVEHLTFTVESGTGN